MTLPKDPAGKNAVGRGVIRKGFALPVITGGFDFLTGLLRGC